MAEPLRSIIDPGWADALEPVAGRIAAMGDFLRAEVAAGRRYLPAGENVLRAFKQPFAGVRVLIVGQDPYPTPGHAVGLSFSVAPEVRPIPRSLNNIYQEMESDLGLPRPSEPCTPGARRWWRSSGAATPEASPRCSRACRASNRPTPARCRPTAASS